jgi:hypothetical protein
MIEILYTDNTLGDQWKVCERVITCGTGDYYNRNDGI